MFSMAFFLNDTSELFKTVKQAAQYYFDDDTRYMGPVLLMIFNRLISCLH